MKKMIRNMAAAFTLAALGLSLAACGKSEEDVLVLRVSNWEEYIDQGDWDEDELIDLEDGTEIIGESSLVEDFEVWYEETYGRPIRVEYSTFGTNEELYNQLTIGDTFDLVCPSEYMIMKMMREGMIEPYSEDFKNEEIEENYYTKGVSPYVVDVYKNLNIEGMKLSDYAAGYMWGTLGLVYNPDEVSEEQAAHWNLMLNPDFRKRITVKDSVRDALFAAVTMRSYDEITTEEFLNDPDYHERLSELLNRTDPETVDIAQDILTQIKENVYSFETDSGKADMVTGKVVANEQWSGDAVYTMDQAEDDDVVLYYSVPEEGANLWFDGWVMLKDGIDGDADKKQAAEAFVNFLSMPENAIRNMYYIGYTSVIAGGDSDLILQYMDWNFGAEEDEEEVVDYPVGYFFDYGNPDADKEYVITAPEEQTRRQLYAQYPTEDVVDRCVVMRCFDDESNMRINRMWINVRCFDLGSIFN